VAEEDGATCVRLLYLVTLRFYYCVSKVHYIC